MNTPSILLVEDSAEDAELIVSALKTAVSVDQVTVCPSGETALDFLLARGEYAHRLHEELPRIILLDLSLPLMSGFEVLRVLRATAKTRLLPVIVLSASVEQPDIQRATKLGANSYVRKSLDFARLCDNMALLARYWTGLNIPPPMPPASSTDSSIQQ